MLLSIIIPVYNVAPYVERCIRSCLSQDISRYDYEIIVVNDGSTDTSLDIVNNLAYDFQIIHVLSQPNAGLSAARNAGMQIAQGKYYMFVDSDDWIADNCLGKLSRKLIDEKPDALAICAADVIGCENQRRQSYQNETPIMGRELLRCGVSPCAPFAIWSAAFFKRHNLTFYEGIFHEDSELIPKAFYLARKVSKINDIIYFVRQNPRSITRSVNPKRSFDLVDVVCPRLSAFGKNTDPKYRPIFHDMVSMYLNNALSYIRYVPNDNQRLLDEMIYSHRCLLGDLRNSTKVKYRIEYYLFIIFPKHYVLIYTILKGLFG